MNDDKSYFTDSMMLSFKVKDNISGKYIKNHLTIFELYHLLTIKKYDILSLEVECWDTEKQQIVFDKVSNIDNKTFSTGKSYISLFFENENKGQQIFLNITANSKIYIKEIKKYVDYTEILRNRLNNGSENTYKFLYDDLICQSINVSNKSNCFYNIETVHGYPIIVNKIPIK